MTLIVTKKLFEETVSIKVSFKNLTSQMTPQGQIELISLSATGCVLQLPLKSCTTAHMALIGVRIQEKVRQAKFESNFTGKILDTAEINGSYLEVKIHFTQFIKEDLDKMLGILEIRQKQIGEIIKTLKEI